MGEIFVDLFYKYRFVRIIVGFLMLLVVAVLWPINAWLLDERAAQPWWMFALIITSALLLIGFGLRGTYRRIFIGCLLILGAGVFWRTNEDALQAWWALALMIISALLLIGFTIRRREQQKRLQQQSPQQGQYSLQGQYPPQQNLRR